MHALANDSSTFRLLHLPLSPFYSISANPARPVEFCVSGKYESVVRSVCKCDSQENFHINRVNRFDK